MLDYWEVRKLVSKLIPRMTQLTCRKRDQDMVREKGRKKNYQQFNLLHEDWRKQERLLNTEEINSFLEISIRAAACPMPFNMDIWDGLLCPFNCIYCYANAFRASLYTAFFDNSKTMGFRHCNPDYYKKEMDKMGKLRSLPFEEKQKLTGINKAFALEIPVRMGIRFEDFLRNEKREGTSLAMLEYLAEIGYPVMINTKSNIPGTDKYVRALSENSGGSAIHITIISNNKEVIKKLEPGAPPYEQRIKAAKALTDAGVRVVARIEPYLFLLTDDKDEVYRYMAEIKDAGIHHITFDTYSYTALNPGIRQSFINVGYDFDRLFLAGCDSQPFGSLLLGKFMELFRKEGFSCSTFDMGNVPTNNQSVCCEVGDLFKGGFNYGCTVMAAKFIKSRKGKPTTWKRFDKYVWKKGGWLSEELRQNVHLLWNLSGNVAYSHRWAQGMVPAGINEDGFIWKYVPSVDTREQLLLECL